MGVLSLLVELGGLIAVAGMTGIGAQLPVPEAPRSGKCCPEAAIRGGTRIGSVAGNPAFVAT
jgi:hypothetical protein